MTVWSRRGSSRRLGSKSLVSGLATGLGSIGAFALGVTLVAPNIGSGPSNGTPPGYVVSDDAAAGSGDGRHAQLTDPIDQKNQGDTGPLPSGEDHEFIPGDRAGSGGADGLTGNEPLYQAENFSGFASSDQQGQYGGADAAGGRSQSGGHGNRDGAYSFNAPGSRAFQGAADDQTFPGDAPFVTNFEDDGLGGGGPDRVADLGSNFPAFDSPGDSGANTPGPDLRGPGPSQNVDPADETEPDPFFETSQFSPPNEEPGSEEPVADPNGGNMGGDAPQSDLPPKLPQLSGIDQVAHEVPAPGALGLMICALPGMWAMRRSRYVR